MIQQTRAFKKKVAWSLLVCMVMETMVFPTTAYALTNGPKQPEFEKFTPIATTNMVNTFTGDFQYNLPVLNIPGADGGGYALSLSYNADPSMDSEASWVGQNWTLNPGALSRGKRGLPDDYKGQVIEYNKVRPNFSYSRTHSASVSVGFGDSNSGGNVGLAFNDTYQWNNMSGYGNSKYIGLSGGAHKGGVQGGLNFGFNFSGREVTFAAGLSIGLNTEKFISKAKNNIGKAKSASAWAKKTLLNLARGQSLSYSVGTSGQFGLVGHINSSVASVVKPSRTMSYTMGFTGQALLGPVTASYGVSETTTAQANKPLVDYKAYGYMYNPDKQKHLDHKAAGEHIMSDYGIEKNSNYSYRDNITGIVYSNADNFNAIGEGISGSYKLQHDKVGHYYSDFLANGKSRNVSAVTGVTAGAGFALGQGGSAGVAVKIGASFQFEQRGTTSAKRWLLTEDHGNITTNVDNYEFDPNSLPTFRAKNDLGGGLLYVDPSELDELVKEYRGGFFGRVSRADGQGGQVTDGADKGNRPNISHFISTDKYSGSDYYKGQSSHMEYVRNTDLKCSNCSTGLRTVNQGEALDKHPRVLQYIDKPQTGQVVDQGNGSVDNSYLEEHIAQIKVWNPDGMKYTYGLPVYVRNEANFTYGVDPYSKNFHKYGNGGNGRAVKLLNKNLVYPQTQGAGTGTGERELTVKQGQELREWYANTYLMTQITTADYVDLTNNGATEDDFGGYTRFDYRRWFKRDAQQHYSMNNWYRFRAPYTGLKYNPGELAKKSDDIGSVSHGFREMYYLNAIETKSHVAVFITNKTVASRDFAHLGITDSKYDGSGDIRQDGLGQVLETPSDEPKDMDGSEVDYVFNQAPNYSSSTQGSNATYNSQALNSPNAKDKSQDVEKLERIVLFAKSDLEIPLSTTHFDYDYSAWKGVHNNINSNAVNPAYNNNNSGKLTLKKVWSEYEGVRRHKVSPYEFVYEYAKPNDFASEVRNRYPHIFDPTSGDWPNAQAVNTGNSLVEKPIYNPHAIGRWGNYAYDGASRRENYMSWLYQGRYDDAKGYDPAAWQLKQVKLPSGGEIHIQYEEKTYQKVQDKTAMAMVSLLDGLSVDDQVDGTHNNFYLNLADMGISASDRAEQEKLVELIRKTYMQDSDLIAGTGQDYYYQLKTQKGKKDDRIYFKFKYQLHEGSAEEYISGYAVVRTVGIDDDGVHISIGNALNKGSFVERKDIPRQLCYDHIQYNNHANHDFEYATGAADLSGWLDYNSDYNAFSADVEGSGAPTSSLGEHVDESSFIHMGANFNPREYPTYESGSTCKQINYPLSFIRVPMTKAKRGNGVRVKRVLMYDEGMETGDAQLFGMEYDYVKTDGTCSGVATNEPNEGREENALVDYEKRNDQDWFMKVFAGRDRKEGEVPYGEFLLPPPMVNYSRVVTSSIYKGNQQNDGFKVQEFFTMEDYPTKMNFNDAKFGILNGQKSVQYTNLGSGKPTGNDKKLNYKRTSFIPLNFGLFNYNQHYRWTNQAFMFIQTNMNGQKKSEQTYGGVYNRDYFINPTANGNMGIALTSKTTYDYIQPGEKAKVLSFDKTANEYKMEEHHLGVEDDVTMSAQTVYEENFGAGMNLSFMITYFGGFAVTPSLGFNFSFSERGMSRHLTTRVLYFPAVLKSVTTQMNKSVSTVEHMAFSDLTGAPILTKTTDGFDRNIVVNNAAPGGPQTVMHDGAIYNWNMPAAWFYDEMGKRSIDPTHTNQLMASSGSITSYGKDGNPLPSSPGPLAWTSNPKGVLAASAVSLKKNNWFSINGPILSEYGATLTTAKFAELEQQYRPHKTFVYNPIETTSSANDDGVTTWGQGTHQVFNSGVYDNFHCFDWRNLSNNTHWETVSEINLYSPNGAVLEELNTLTNTPSAAKYGYHKFLPTAIAQNAEYNTIHFESFEDEKFADFTSPHANLKEGGHAGKYAFEVTTSAQTIFDQLKISSRMVDPTIGDGFTLRLWAKNELKGPNNKVIFGDGTNHIEAQLKNGGTVFTSSREKKIAQVGEWVLLEYKFEAQSLGSPSAAAYDLTLKAVGREADGAALTSVIVDDIRIQPTNAEMKTHVYDNKNFKVLATFGAEHFGMFYQYNDEGKLVRTLVETERGMKTVQENQMNTPRNYTPVR